MTSVGPGRRPARRRRPRSGRRRARTSVDAVLGAEARRCLHALLAGAHRARSRPRRRTPHELVEVAPEASSRSRRCGRSGRRRRCPAPGARRRRRGRAASGGTRSTSPCSRRRGSRRRPSCRSSSGGQGSPANSGARAPRGATSSGRRRGIGCVHLGGRGRRSAVYGFVARAACCATVRSPSDPPRRSPRWQAATVPAAGRSPRDPSARLPARCSAPSGSPRTTSASRRSAWPRVERGHARATTTSASSPRSRRKACARAGRCPIEFTTIAVSDGIAMGHEGMKASLMSRDLIADSVELVMHAERFDGVRRASPGATSPSRGC